MAPPLGHPSVLRLSAMVDEGAMSFGITPIDADGSELELRPGEVPSGCIGLVAETPNSGGTFVAVPVTEGATAIDGNLGTYPTFELAVEALRANHRRPWTREERRRAAGGW